MSSVCVVALQGGDADAVAERLGAVEIETRRWWSGGCHLQPAFAACPRERLAVTEHLARTTLGLPFFVDMDETHARRIVGALAEAVADG